VRARSRPAIGGVTEGVRTPRATLRHGSGWHRGRSDRARRSPLVPVSSARQAKACRRAHEEQRHRLSIRRHGGAHHFHSPRCTLRSPADGKGRNEGYLRHQSPQPGHGLQGPSRAPGSDSELGTLGGDLYGTGLRSRLCLSSFVEKCVPACLPTTMNDFKEDWNLFRKLFQTTPANRPATSPESKRTWKNCERTPLPIGVS